VARSDALNFPFFSPLTNKLPIRQIRRKKRREGKKKASFRNEKRLSFRITGKTTTSPQLLSPRNGSRGRSSQAPYHPPLRRQRPNPQHNPSSPALPFHPYLSPPWPQRTRLQRLVVPVFATDAGEGGGGRGGSGAYRGILRQPRPRAFLQGQGNPEAPCCCFRVTRDSKHWIETF
jgi:hypothetical protein